MTGEERKNRNRRGKLSTINDNTKNCLIRGINIIKYKNVDNTKKYDFFATIIVLFCYIYYNKKIHHYTF
jgi:ribosomal protein L24